MNNRIKTIQTKEIDNKDVKKQRGVDILLPLTVIADQDLIYSEINGLIKTFLLWIA